MTRLINGKAFANSLCENLEKEVAGLRAAGIVPTIAVVLVGDDPASHVYVRNKIQRCAQLNIRSVEHKLDTDTSENDLLARIEQLNSDVAINGILVQLPLPAQIEQNRVITAISPGKDVDGFHIENVGALALGKPGFIPCTPLGSLLLLEDVLPNLSGLHAVVVGRSNIVGKPMANLLLSKNCTVTIAHSRTKDLEAECRRADILVAAVGKPKLIKGNWIKPGATVIDVGINRIFEDDKPKLCGDVDFNEAVEGAGAITPVPGGVGPMTIACLMVNTINAAKRQNNLQN